MGVIAVFMGLLAAVGVWAFFVFQPAHARRESLSAFNWSIFGVTLFLALIWFLNTNSMFAAPAYDKYRDFIAWSGAFGIIGIVLVVMLLLRNFWIFGGASRRGYFG